jgi:hypothetical protein
MTMMRKTAVWILLASLSATMTWAGPQLWPAASAGKTEAGYVLLDRILVLFRNLAMHGSGGERGREAVEKGLEDIMTEAVQAKTKNQLDPVYFRRFNRLLVVMKLAITSDSKGILKSHIDRMTADFVEDISGQAPALGKDGSVGLGALAAALADEIANLRIHLDTKEQKAKLLEQWMNSFPDGKK